MDEKELRLKFKNEFEFYAENALKIRTKEGDVKPFVLNKAQLFLHKKLQEQKRLTGKVRALVLKGRQQGCSTYVAARFYHQITHRKGAKCFIITHRDDATTNLYKLVNRYHENCLPQIKPSTGVSNARELFFDKLDSGYGIGTAGSGNLGRSDTIQYLHGSEVAFWNNTDEISAGIMQTVPDVKDTEIILESTANGRGNLFHRMCVAAMDGLSEFQLIFIPWFWQDEYRKELPEDFRLTPEEAKYKDLYKLDDQQMSWRRNKIANFSGGEWQFKQEYPATANEAFQTSTQNSLILPELVIRARKAEVPPNQNNEPLVIGVDVGRNKDSTTIYYRRGRIQSKHERYKGWDTNQVVGHLVQILNNDRPEKMFIDLGYNPGVYDRLQELGYKGVVVGVNFGGTADNPERYANKRAEMWDRANLWLRDEPCKIEDDEKLHSDLVCVSPKPPTSKGQLLLEDKESIRKNYGMSPDDGDAFVLTFAFIIPNKAIQERYGIGNIEVKSDWSVYD